MGWTKSTLRQGIASQLSILGNIKLQMDLWEGNIPGFISYYDECLNYLEDYGIPLCLKEFVEKNFLTQEELKDLVTLDNLLGHVIKTFLSQQPSNQEVWQSIVWKKFSAEANTILKNHFQNDLEEKGEPYTQWQKKYSE